MPRLLLLLVLLAGLALPGAQAAPYPERPVKVIVPFPPGGGVDVTARLVGERLTAALGQPFVIENRAGAAGIIGCEMAAKAAPDGYTLLVTSTSTHGTNSGVHKTLPYDPVTDYTPIALMTRVTYLLLASPKLPVGTVAELIAWARPRGQKLNYGSYGLGSVNHLPMELLAAMSGLELVHIPYKGAAPASAALSQGEIDLLIDSPVASAGAIRSGMIKLLGVAGPTRSPMFPDAPTIPESGLPGFQADAFFGLFGPAGTPATVTEPLYRAVAAALAEPALRERLVSTGFEVVGAPGPVLGAAVLDAVTTAKRLVAERKLTFE